MAQGNVAVEAAQPQWGVWIGTVAAVLLGSQDPVRPIARLRVTPGDFPFLEQVAGHREGESMLRSWLMYKRRRGLSVGWEQAVGPTSPEAEISPITQLRRPRRRGCRERG